MRENSNWDSESDFKNWSVDRVGYWLSMNNFGEYRQQFVNNNITGDLLLQLNYTWLKEIGVLVVGDRARILQAIQRQFLRPTQDTTRQLNRTQQEELEITNNKLENRKGLLPPPNDKSPRSSTSDRVRTNRSFSDVRKPENRYAMSNDDNSSESTPKQLRKASTEKSNPIQIFPRTSSKKESNSNKQLNEAYDVIFGSTKSIPQLSPQIGSSSPKPRTSKTTIKSPKTAESPVLREQDIMKMRNVRDVSLINKKYIRVQGKDNQTHVINVDKMKSGVDIRKKVLTKFGIGVDNNDWIIGTVGIDNSIDY